MNNRDKYAISYQAAKRNAVISAIKVVAPQCKGNFEIPMSAMLQIEKDNSLRKRPIRASYDYIKNLTFEMLQNNEI